MKFTLNETEILLHRLEVPDAMTEALEDNGRFTSEVLEIWIGRIQRELERGSYTLHYTDGVEGMILREAAAGSTFLACAYTGWQIGDLTRQKLTAYENAADSLGDKLGVSVPN